MELGGLEIEQKNGEVTGQPLYRVKGFAIWSPSPEQATKYFRRYMVKKEPKLPKGGQR